ncbi:MAG: DUF58 domain-containing protein [Acidobacteriota bacterium]
MTSAPGRRGRRRSRRAASVPEGIRITKVGLWYVLFTVIVAIAATNTGNNALYMVLSAMLGALAFSGIVSRQNVRGLVIETGDPGEVFAKRPFRLDFQITNRGRFMSRWCLLVSFLAQSSPRLVPFLERRGSSTGSAELLLPRRGLRKIPFAHVSSLFPFGFFRKGVRYRTELEVMVFPEIFPAAGPRLGASGRLGEESSRRQGRGHDLHSLRTFRPGDDPRRIHWKQTARTGDLIYRESEAEESHRLAILLDNGVAPFADEAAEERFEQLVSEAATAALDHLTRGYAVELVTRDQLLPFAGGRRQRLRILETLALLEAIPVGRSALRSSDPSAAELRLAMQEPERAA